MGLFSEHVDSHVGPEVDTEECLCKFRGTPAEQAAAMKNEPDPQAPVKEPFPDLSFSEIAYLLAKLSKEVAELKEKLGG